MKIFHYKDDVDSQADIRLKNKRHEQPEPIFTPASEKEEKEEKRGKKDKKKVQPDRSGIPDPA